MIAQKDIVGVSAGYVQIKQKMLTIIAAKTNYLDLDLGNKNEKLTLFL